MAVKSFEQIEADLDYSRNALARRKLTADESEDPASLLLWQAALDNGDILASTVRSMAQEGAAYQQALDGVTDRLAQAERSRAALEAENGRLTREVENLFSLIQELRPGELQRFVQARQQIQQ
jgi:cell division protein FtsB